MTGDSWTRHAACTGMATAVFFPETPDGGPGHVVGYGEARAVCTGCPVRQECLDYAVDNGIRWGMWDGLTAQERAAVKRLREAS